MPIPAASRTAYGTIDAELGQLKRTGQEAAWRNSKDTWASHGAPQQPAATAAGGAGHTGLTPRELDVLRLLGTGASNEEIGHRLYISPKTASVHVSHIFRKLGIHGRFQAAMVAERTGLVTTGRGDDSRAP